MARAKKSDIFDEVPQAPPPSEAEMAGVAILIPRLMAARLRLDRAEDELRAAKAALAEIEEKALPGAMIHALMDGFDLQGGGRVRLATDYLTSLPSADKRPEDRAKAMALIPPELLTRGIKITFPRADTNQAARITEIIQREFADAPDDKKPKVVESVGVHASTLKAYVKRKVIAGEYKDGDAAFRLLNIWVRHYADVDIPGAAGGAKSKARRTEEAAEEDDE